MKRINNISKPGFKAPDNYFDSVEEGVFARLKSDNLKSMVEQTGFKIPDGYFDGLEERVEDKLKGDEPKVIPLFSRKKLYYISGIAAAIVILLAVFLNRSSEEFQDLDYQMVETYIINQDISTYEIASLLTEEEIEQVDLNILDEKLNDESLEDYLLENINLEDIIDQ